MTIREECGWLLGRDIVRPLRPEEVPCKETSDADRLCPNPVVSVVVTTYNQEPYIRQTLDGILMQQTNFEFEVVIGEDASQDRTREICFEYQQKHPDKIRVLWSTENVFRRAGNVVRILARCRGEFIAFCEGDDYWIDPLKLKKQVEVMRSHPTVSMCFTDGRRYIQATGQFLDREFAREKTGRFTHGLIDGKAFFSFYADAPTIFAFTPGILIRKVSTKKLLETRFGREAVGQGHIYSDHGLILAMSLIGDVYALSEDMVVYRQGVGISWQSPLQFYDAGGLIISYFYARVTDNGILAQKLLRRIFQRRLRLLPWLGIYGRMDEAKKVLANPMFADLIVGKSKLLLKFFSMIPIPSFAVRSPLLLRRMVGRLLGREGFVYK